jgi:hypothetical protein
MYQFLDEQDMWSLVEKNPKETGVLEIHNTKVLCIMFMRMKNKNKNHVFLNQSGEHIFGYMIHLKKTNQLKKQKNTKLEQIKWNFNNLCPTICKIFYSLLHKMCMS